jgi:creatinine amidohydrolase/Fe(II)-dependent formamide hydrolase-like protein
MFRQFVVLSQHGGQCGDLPTKIVYERLLGDLQERVVVRWSGSHRNWGIWYQKRRLDDDNVPSSWTTELIGSDRRFDVVTYMSEVFVLGLER